MFMMYISFNKKAEIRAPRFRLGKYSPFLRQYYSSCQENYYTQFIYIIPHGSEYVPLQIYRYYI